MMHDGALQYVLGARQELDALGTSLAARGGFVIDVDSVGWPADRRTEFAPCSWPPPANC
ncbi:MAG: hypothetical protein QM658_12460 [Gordonia sp. (in: high G+C Gram-positive bacteria)]